MIGRSMAMPWCCVALALPWGCGGKTNLLDPSWTAADPDSGSTTDGAASASPQQVIGAQPNVCNIVVRNGRVYWSTTSDWAQASPPDVRGCDTDDCQNTMTIYATRPSSGNDAYGAIAVDDTAFYWSADRASYSCPIVGCTDPSVAAFFDHDASMMVVDPTTFFWSDRYGFGGGAGVYGCSRIGCIPSAIDAGDNTWRTAGAIGVNDSAVYWIREGASGSVKRADKTGGTPVELASQQNQPVGLFVDNDFVYWTTRWASGDVLRCPQSGCEGQPTVLASNQPRPTSLVVDSNSVFWTVAPSSPSHDDVGESINRCDLDHCAETQTTLVAGIHPSGCPQNLAQDDSYVYWAEGSPGLGTLPTPTPEGVVMRIRK